MFKSSNNRESKLTRHPKVAVVAIAFCSRHGSSSRKRRMKRRDNKKKWKKLHCSQDPPSMSSTEKSGCLFQFFLPTRSPTTLMEEGFWFLFLKQNRPNHVPSNQCQCEVARQQGHIINIIAKNPPQ